ncbi:putative polyketide synthase [Rosellinia necatrix]|uniref:Putative polyketide synthase n=1 Tax=Rosellinia necatrix TaxID=77044 RepID=A0A1W2TUC6_ROSNE|nr:putative polyketide synthase [Rosellinia necatrix]
MDINEKIAIIGCGLRFPGGTKSLAELWDLVHHPRNLAQEIPPGRFRAQGYYHENGEYHGHGNIKEAYFLEDDAHMRFDAPFFGISHAEAALIDPQARLLLETVYEALDAAGLSVDSLKGSDTAVYVGQMVADYEQVLARDLDSMGKYHATGTSRALISNRISYFFDWHGPSVTIDTACSSSLVAVHQAVQQLRSGQSRVAIVAGANMIFDPHCFLAESTLHMLSPEGRSRMWDIDANGYARGEGIAAIILKTLSAAKADGDDIEGVIRETGVNQDGRTHGITMPNSRAQAQLIRSCYTRAGLDISDPQHWPQYFEAHGTGTPAGDPIEAEAINLAFSPNADVAPPPNPLYVGSIKTLVGHTEGTAGLAGVLKACLALRNAIIPPNLLFSCLNPNIKPFYANLHVPTSAVSWPSPSDDGPRRASVNSFGFGGTNAHAILESYLDEKPQGCADDVVFAPFVFSAVSKQSLSLYMTCFLEYLQTLGKSVRLADIAYTLYARRTHHQWSTSLTALSLSELCEKLKSTLQMGEMDPSLPPQAEIRRRRLTSDDRPIILGVFTGQGAQWAQMGLDLIRSSSVSRGIIQKLQDRLNRLPERDAPSWSLLEELERDASISRVGEAAISQPLCTAVQIVQVELLRAAGIELSSVVGHSSGEITCAFAAGFISAEDAICIAYYRGLHSRNARPGSMLAVGTSAEDAQHLLSFPEFEGRACLAAINSPASVTISGDTETIHELKVIFEDEKKFSRVLQVDKAYHSNNMMDCSNPYLQSLACLDIQTCQGQRAMWYSSVYGGDMLNRADSLAGKYWDDNMVQPVCFMQALQNARVAKGEFDLIVEFGPHPALKGPSLQVLEDGNNQPPYIGLFNRGSSSVQSLAKGLGLILSCLGPRSVDIYRYNQFVSDETNFSLVKGLPNYAWNHEKKYWHESRYAHAIRMRHGPVHELLGHITPDSFNQEMRWRNILRPDEIHWLPGHQLHGQIILPASAYVIMAIEAAATLCPSKACSSVEVFDIDLARALAFDQDTAAMEIIFSLTNIVHLEGEAIEANFKCSGALGYGVDGLGLLASGKILIRIRPDEGLSCNPLLGTIQHSTFIEVPSVKFYTALQKLGYHYTGPFKTLNRMKRKLGAATGYISIEAVSGLILHPAVLDAAFQSAFLAYAAPGDNRLSTVHIPRRIDSVVVDTALCSSITLGKSCAFDTIQQSHDKGAVISADINLYPYESTYAAVHVRGLRCVPLAREAAEDDRNLFAEVVWDVATPNIESADYDNLVELQAQDELGCVLERMAMFYLRALQEGVPNDHPARREGPYQHWFHFASTNLTKAKIGDLPTWRPEWETDATQNIEDAMAPYSHIIDVQLLHAIGHRIIDIATGTKLPIDIGIRDNMLARYYSNGLGLVVFNRILAQTVRQIAHRYPRMHILEIGGGTGGATKVIFNETDGMFSSYTFTDISSIFLDDARNWAEGNTDKMILKTLDIGQDPRSQGFQEHSYDLVIASFVLHTTSSLEKALCHARHLLKPGGYLIALELLPTNYVHYGVMFGAFSGWWLGAQEGRVSSPAMTRLGWNSLLQKSGFSGCDAITPELDKVMTPAVVFVTQAVDQRINFLRDPLSPLLRPPSPEKLFHDLVIIGGKSAGAPEIMAQTSTALKRYCANIVVYPSLHDICLPSLSPKSTVLSLVEIDEEIFKNQESWDGIQGILHSVGSLMWVTRGRRQNNPYSNAFIGLIRSAVREIPSLDYFFLDVEPPTRLDVQTIVESVLRYKAITHWQSEGQFNITAEAEQVLDSRGFYLIPRLLPSKSMNDRYNSTKRSIVAPLDITKLRVAITDSHPLLERVPPPDIFDVSMPSMEITHSFVSAVRVSEYGFLYLILGKDITTEQQQVALSTKNTRSNCPHSNLTIPIPSYPGSEHWLLALIAYHIWASIILEGLSEGDELFIHDADQILATTICSEAAVREVQVIFSATEGRTRLQGLQDCNVQFHTSKNTISQSLLDRLTVFIDCEESPGNSFLGKYIRSHLPPHCKKIAFHELLNTEPRPPKGLALKRAKARLKVSTLRSCQYLNLVLKKRRTLIPATPVVAVSELSNETPLNAIIDWTLGSQALVRLSPADSLVIFSNDKTFWLVGLTGGLGLSLCEWMIHRGARYIMLSSRNPKIDPAWLANMQTLGATVKISSCDITQKQDVISLYSDMCSSMPPIGGVAQGAMVLQDTPLRDMTLDILHSVMRPKVEGTIYLDQLFQDNTLDFFVLFSSATSVNGNAGQSAYTAANLFMTALAEQRRQRGLSASVIHIGPIFGIGYIAQALDETTIFAETTMRSGGYIATSEYDFHQLFAEAILAGRPGSIAPIEILTGLHQIEHNAESLPMWESSPIMNHFTHNHGSLGRATSSRNTISIKAQLAEAQNPDHITKIVKTAFITKLQILFQLDTTEGGEADLLSTPLNQMGIDSLSAVEIRSWFLKTLEVNIPVLKILNNSTAGDLADLACQSIIPRIIQGNQESDSILEANANHKSLKLTDGIEYEMPDGVSQNSPHMAAQSEDTRPKALAKHELTQTMKLSFSQEMFWFVWASLSDKTSLNHTGWARIKSKIRVHDFEDAVRSIAMHHTILRACFSEQNGVPVQSIMSSSRLKLEHRCISNEHEVQAAADVLNNTSFDVQNGETVRLLLLSMSSTQHFLIFGIHPLVMDGLSFQILLHQLIGLYLNPSTQLCASQYLDYAEKQRRSVESSTLDKDLLFWKAEFLTIPPPLPILKVSALTSRPPLVSYENEKAVLRISKETKIQIQSVCRRCGVTPFHFYLATFRALLLRYADDAEDIVIGVGDANRTEDDMMEVIGPFINLLPVRLITQASSKFEDLLQYTRTQVLKALQYSGVPFQILLSKLGIPRSSTYTSLFQCFIDYRQGQRERFSWGDVEMQFESFQSSKLGYDVALDIIDDPIGDCVHILEVRKDIYGKSGVKRLIKSYERLIKSYAIAPTTALDEPNIVDSADTEEAIRFSQGPSRSSSWPETVVHRIDEMIRQQPDAIAVINPDNSLASYATLSTQVHAISTALLSAGVGPNSTIAVFQEATHFWVSSILGIWHMGATYVPLDLGLPLSRLAAMVEDCRPVVILVDSQTAPRVHKVTSSAITTINVTGLDAQTPREALPIVPTAETPSVILYTSGSTGTAKGVILKHGGLRNFSEMIAPIFGLRSEVVLQQTSSVFDLSLIQITTALCHGGSLCLIPWNQRGDAIGIGKAMVDHSITFTCGTPSEYRSWLNHGKSQLSRCANWKIAVAAGEPIPTSFPARLSSMKQSLRFYNLYGPSETSLAATAIQVQLPCEETTPILKEPISAGPPLPNYSVYVLDSKLRPMPVGVQGEIYIGGAGVGAGYLNRPILTTEKFIPDILADRFNETDRGTLLHRTGDIGRWDRTGALFIEGRIAGDTQIKLRGMRIDLGEVENAIIYASNDAISEALVSVPSSHAEDDELLVAYVVFDQSSTIEDVNHELTALPSELRRILPQYMCPAIITPVQSLPRMNSGKVDRKAIAALPFPEMIPCRHANTTTSLTDMERRLSLLWHDVVVRESPTIHSSLFLPQTDFFYVGGTSLRLLGLQASILKTFNVRISILDMFEHSTLAEMARCIEGAEHEVHITKPHWDAEASLPLELRDVPYLTSVASDTDTSEAGKTAVLTGATGAVGRALLKALSLDSNVKHIHCLGVRDTGKHRDLYTGKVTLHSGDLSLPRLGLSKETAGNLFSEADFIVHNGAEVSYLKNYRSLRKPNVQSTKEIAKMCAPRMVPIHYISTTSVETNDATRRAAGTDDRKGSEPTNFRDSQHPGVGQLASLGSGYTISKQISEHFLKRFKMKYPDWPIWIHRPSLISDKARVGGGPNSVIESIQYYSSLLHAIPVIPDREVGMSVFGTFNIVSMDVVVRGILDAALGAEDTHVSHSVRMLRHVGNDELNISDLRGWVTDQKTDSERQNKAMREISLVEWASRAGEIGMDPTIVVFMKTIAAEMDFVDITPSSM